MEEVTEGQPRWGWGRGVNRARLPYPINPWLENIRMLEGNCEELKAQPLPLLMHTHRQSPSLFFWPQPATWHQNPGLGLGKRGHIFEKYDSGNSGRAQDRADSWGGKQGADILSLRQKRDLASMGTNRTAAQGL